MIRTLATVLAGLWCCYYFLRSKDKYFFTKTMASVSTPKKQTKKAKLFRYFGYFYCPKCKNSWRSAHVYCDPETLEVKYKQKCQTCKTFYEPYKKDAIRCRNCGQTGKECQCKRTGKGRLQDLHRRSLCEKCLQGREFCDQSSYPKGPSIHPKVDNDDNFNDDVDGNENGSDFEDDDYNYGMAYGGQNESSCDSDFEYLNPGPEDYDFDDCDT